MSRGRAWIRALVVASVVVALDQITKAVIEENLAPGERLDVLGPIELTHVTNTGIAFGLAGGEGVAIIGLTVVALAAIVALFAREPTRPGAWLAIGLLIGGALGNLIDRVAKDAVTDFVSLPAWPSFNVADIAITVGVVALAWALLRESSGHRGEGVEP